MLRGFYQHFELLRLVCAHLTVARFPLVRPRVSLCDTRTRFNLLCVFERTARDFAPRRERGIDQLCAKPVARLLEVTTSSSSTTPPRLSLCNVCCDDEQRRSNNTVCTHSPFRRGGRLEPFPHSSGMFAVPRDIHVTYDDPTPSLHSGTRTPPSNSACLGRMTQAQCPQFLARNIPDFLGTRGGSLENPKTRGRRACHSLSRRS